MKKKYMPAELEFVLFGSMDVITASDGTVQPPEEDNAGGDVGEERNPDGWMGI